MIEITYFGVLKEIVGINSESIDWHKGDTDALIATLRARGAIWHEALAPEKIFRVVVNQTICYEPMAINIGDKIALLPPVTGG